MKPTFLSIILTLFTFSCGVFAQAIDHGMEQIDFGLGEWGATREERPSNSILEYGIAVFLQKNGKAWEWALREKPSSEEHWSKISFIPQHRTTERVQISDLEGSKNHTNHYATTEFPKISVSHVRISGKIKFSSPLEKIFKDGNAQLSFYEDTQGVLKNYFFDIEAVERQSGRKIIWTLTPFPDVSRFCPPAYQEISPVICEPNNYQRLKAQALKTKLD